MHRHHRLRAAPAADSRRSRRRVARARQSESPAPAPAPAAACTRRRSTRNGRRSRNRRSAGWGFRARCRRACRRRPRSRRPPTLKSSPGLTARARHPSSASCAALATSAITLGLRVRLEQRGQPVGVQMVRVLMGEQHGGQLGQRLESGGEAARIEQDRVPRPARSAGTSGETSTASARSAQLP